MSSQSDATTVPEVPGTQLPARAGQASHGAATLTLQLRGKRRVELDLGARGNAAEGVLVERVEG